MDLLRILIADDHPMFRDGLTSLLATADDMELAGEAEDGEQAVELCLATQPDVVVMDLNMPRLDGITATRRITAASPHIGILVLTMLDDDPSLFEAVRAGARGFYPKGAGPTDIIRAIRVIGHGEAIYAPAVALRILGYFARLPRATTAFPQLTDRERNILEMITQGMRNEEIAHRLVLSLKTVRNHVSNVYAKLQVADRAQAIIRARNAGVGESR
ncbi:response regulator [Nonomuraea endophytica]|uniref:response regulator n=1 Tax=Nonomuraea endophytica TaxID=714136 RepID=UPI0037CCB415